MVELELGLSLFPADYELNISEALMFFAAERSVRSYLLRYSVSFGLI
ncbi:Uncharacterised protein [Legionella sainthelensi]|nr:Uncharacterised protein [Legionella sainthelensi]